MLAIVSHPMADLRSFLSEETHRLDKPTFPTPTPNRDFVRGTGLVRSRKRGGSQVLAGEDVYCAVSSALRFIPNKRGTLSPGTGGDGEFRSVFRRLYHTGRAAFRCELGFVPYRNTPSEARQLAQQLAAILVRVPEDPKKDDPKKYALGEVGPRLAEHLLLSTTKLRRGRPRSVEKWWCRSCPGMILVEHAADETLSIADHYSTLDHLAEQGILLRHARLEDCGSISGLWLLQYEPTADLRRVRQVRMHLTRVHTEFHCFREIVNAARTDPFQGQIDVESGKLKQYLEGLLGVLDRDKRYGTDQKAILTTTLALAGDAEPGALVSVLEAGDSLRSELESEQQRRGIMEEKYAPHSWERIVAYLVGVTIVLTVLFIVIRNEPFQDPNLVVLIRTLLSLATAVLGAIIPGFLRISWKGKGLLIRAGGALALFVLTFLLTPTVLPT